MILNDKPDEYGNRLKSEGKYLEVTPILWMPDGSTFSLPPAVYPVPNWLVGYRDNQIEGRPYGFGGNHRDFIPGNNGSSQVGISFLLRIMEDSPTSRPMQWDEIMGEVTELVDGSK